MGHGGSGAAGAVHPLPTAPSSPDPEGEAVHTRLTHLHTLSPCCTPMRFHAHTPHMFTRSHIHTHIGTLIHILAQLHILYTLAQLHTYTPHALALAHLHAHTCSHSLTHTQSHAGAA